MPEYTVWANREINTTKARNFRQIVTAGWANLSDGNVDAPTGHFALVHIEPSEVVELKDAVFGDMSDDDYNEVGTIYPGSYIVEEDSDGNTTLIEYLTLDRALEVFNSAQREFAIWDATCPECPMEGPFVRNGGNILKCDNGHTWDPTEGIETKREDMALEPKKSVKKRCPQCRLIRPLNDDGTFKPHGCEDKTGNVRHMFDLLANDPNKSLCRAKGGLVRQVWANVNCEFCLALKVSLDAEPDEAIKPGWRPEAVSDIDDEVEKLYLVHNPCGEAFDDIKIAHEHKCEPQYDSFAEWDIKPESEAL